MFFKTDSGEGKKKDERSPSDQKGNVPGIFIRRFDGNFHVFVTEGLDQIRIICGITYAP